MLSFIYQIARKFERLHQFRPNVLYLNEDHFRYLKREFTAPDDIETMMKWLGMNIILSQDVMHPHVARINNSWSHQISMQAPSSANNPVSHACNQVSAEQK